MRIICDTHIPLFWAHAPSRLSASAAAALEKGRQEGQLSIADLSLWEPALLIDRGRLQLPGDISPVDDLSRLLAMRLQVLPITADIVVLSRSSLFQQRDQLIADRGHGSSRWLVVDHR